MKVCIYLLLLILSNIGVNQDLEILLADLFQSEDINSGIEKYLDSSRIEFDTAQSLAPGIVSNQYFCKVDSHPYFKSEISSSTIEINQDEEARIIDVYDYTLRVYFNSKEDLQTEYNELNSKCIELIKRKELYDQPKQYIFYLESELDMPSLSIGFNYEDLSLYINYETTSKLGFLKRLKSME